MLRSCCWCGWERGNYEVILCLKILHVQKQGHCMWICKKIIPGTSSEDENTFKASRGWFEKSKKWSGIHSVVRHGEAANSAALFQRCFEITENTNLTPREFWKDYFSILNCLNLIDKTWEGVTVVYLFTLSVYNIWKCALILHKIRFLYQ